MIIERNGRDNLTLLELVLHLHGKFRSGLGHLCVTPLQAGVLLFLHRHYESHVSDVAAALAVIPPTLGCGGEGSGAQALGE